MFRQRVLRAWFVTLSVLGLSTQLALVHLLARA
jgi:hypothetical protein